MKRLKAFLRKFFSLSRGETNGFLFLVPLMAVVLFSKPMFRYWSPIPETQRVANSKSLDSLVAQWHWEKQKADTVTPIRHHHFMFNPNNASQEQLTDLGFSPALSQRMINYRAKGGTFKIKSDVRKMYGIDSSLYNELIPFIDLPVKIDKPSFTEKKTEPEAKTVAKIRFDINVADTAQLKKIYGIGNVLSLRIVAYRDVLGGFVSMEQLREVYGLDTTVVATIKERAFVSSDFQVKALDINLASEKELAKHPYLRSKLAKAITTYRFQHGNFTAIEDLQKIAVMDDVTFGKIRPYLILNK